MLAGFFVALKLALLIPTATPAADAQVSGRQVLQKLVEEARKEGQLDIFGGQEVVGKTEQNLMQAFNKRFGLNIKVHVDNTTTEGPKFSQAMLEHQTGLPPTFDAMQGAEDRVLLLQEAGVIQRVDNWEALLREISPEAFKAHKQLSPMGFGGFGFQWISRLKVINYNPTLISKEELPQTRLELGNPKYQGMYSLPPFVSEALYGVLVYPKAQWLETVKSWGKSKPPIIHYPEGIKRMLLGELRFLLSNDYYYWDIKAKNPNAPIGISFFKDLTPMQFSFYFVRKGARHPSAATLFSLWMATPEANRIFENPGIGTVQANLSLGTGPISRQILEMVNKDKVKMVSWYDSEEAFNTFRWYTTKEGAAYARDLFKAQTGRE